MASVASTDTHMSTEVSTEDTLTTTASAMLRPSLTHGAMASVASMDTHMSTEVSTEDTLTTTASVMLRPSLTHGAMASVASMDTHMSTEETLTTTASAMLMLTPINSSEVSCQTMVDITAISLTPMAISCLFIKKTLPPE